MSYEPLHHKYRPQTFSDLVGQEAIATTLTNALRQNRIAPAYFFTGPRGTGKTSSARILAKSLNCLSSNGPTDKPCGKCRICKSITDNSSIDVIEIDAASNTGVDNIRTLIERAQFAPGECRYKVYIIDEVHMLSVAAFNALLKTLEEPPPQVVFVLATTDPQRVLPTIISRCQRYDFRRIPLDAMVQHLKTIAQKENITIADDAVTLVGQIAQGGLRDAESMLDQMSLFEDGVTVEKVWDFVGAIPEKDLMAMLDAIASNIPSNVLDRARYIMDRGREPLILLQNLAGFYRDLLIAKTAPTRSDLVAITPPSWQQLCEFAQQWDISLILTGQKHLRDSEVQIKNTTQSRLWLEVTLLGLLPSAIIVPQKPSIQATPIAQNTQPHPERTPESNVPKSQNPGISNSPTPAPKPASEEIQRSENPPAVSERAEAIAPDSEIDRVWQTVIAHLQPPSTQALLRQHCQLLSFDGTIARLSISSNPLYKIAHLKLRNVEEAFLKAFNQKVTVSLEVAGATPTNGTVSEEKPPPRPDVSQQWHQPTAPDSASADIKDAQPTANGGQMNAGRSDENEELAIATQHLVNYFNGAQLTLSNHLQMSATAASKDIEPTVVFEADSNPPDEDDLYDIPF